MGNSGKYVVPDRQRRPVPRKKRIPLRFPSGIKRMESPASEQSQMPSEKRNLSGMITMPVETVHF